MTEEKRHEVRYHTLELSYEDKWAVCSKDTAMHSCLDFWDSADKDKFIQWVMGLLHR